MHRRPNPTPVARVYLSMKLSLRWVPAAAVLGTVPAAAGCAAKASASRPPVSELVVPPLRVAEPPPEGSAPPPGEPMGTLAALESAEQSYRTFLEKAGDRPEYRDAVLLARQRLDDIAATKAFLHGKAR